MFSQRVFYLTCFTCCTFATRSSFAAGTLMCLLTPTLHSVYISADLLQGHLQTHAHTMCKIKHFNSGVEDIHLSGGSTVTSHRLSMGILPQVAVAVT